uniref:Uncharacterized protein n=1 Tax=Arundo donax TaxID=35708 RepID=A0A0A9AS16_ARUDO
MENVNENHFCPFFGFIFVHTLLIAYLISINVTHMVDAYLTLRGLVEKHNRTGMFRSTR